MIDINNKLSSAVTTDPIVARTSPRGALGRVSFHYGGRSSSKWDIFRYIYAALHHPQYRQRYAANLRRELPRIPFVGVNGIYIPDNVILSEGAAHQSGAPSKPAFGLLGWQSAPESKDAALAHSADMPCCTTRNTASATPPI